ncbi:MAG: hypothetical protein OXG26_11005 [Caldilineaceae bacterium]|nr:hypothetical protein [Caldilineaceae bacterium]
MVTLVTPVGTSLFTNYLNDNSNDGFRRAYETIRKSPASDWIEYDYEIDDLRTTSLAFIAHKNESASAELQSIAKIQAELQNHINVRLLASDTIVSRLAAEILADETATSVLSDQGTVEFDAGTDVITGLQVENPKTFSNEGMTNLIRKIDSTSANAGGRQATAINITGGFKATLPYLTIWAQLNSVPLYYTFEETDALIKIPQAPLTIDWDVVERHSDMLHKIADGIENWSSFRDQHYQAVQDLEAFIEVDGQDALLSPIGEIFWEHYHTHFIVELPRGSYSPYDSKCRQSIDKAIVELYQRLNTVLGPDFLDPEHCYDHIRNLGHNDDLNHSGQIPNPTGSQEREIFIFKSTNDEQVRLLYTFSVKEREIARLRIFDILCRDFDHESYIEDWKGKFGRQAFPEISFVTRTFEIPSRILSRRIQHVQTS